MTNYVTVNGYVMNENASVAQLREYVKRYKVKLSHVFTFNSTAGLRRVIRLESEGKAYAVYTFEYITVDEQRGIPRLVTLSESLAREHAKEINGTVIEFKANTLDFSDQHIQKYF